MEIIIRNTGGQPIYEQIYSQLKAQIIAGVLTPGEALPSIRALAKDLKISVITTKRAYEDLERDGFITTIVGKGSFVREADREFVKEEQLKAVESHLQAAIDAARQYGMSQEELIGVVKMLYEEM